MAKAFGKTWWGQKWLEAFTDIDDTGRLTRGRTYARNGSISNKVIRGTAIEAKVKGSRATPYSTYVEMKAFDSTDKKIILTLLQKKPELWQQLTQRQLPKDLFELLEQEDIHLFPKRWRDFKAACSCPDYAMPCKHIAALIYSFSEEIDANPFLIFLLHDFDLLSYIEQNAQKQKMASMPKWEEKWLLLEDIKELPEPKEIEKLDISFAQIPNLEQTLLQLLSSNPPFFEKEDFKSILQTTYQKLPKTIEEYWKEYETEEEREEDKEDTFYNRDKAKKKKEDKNYYEIERFEFTFDASYKLRNTFKVAHDKKQKRKLTKTKIDNGFGFLLDLFYTLPTTEIKRLSEQLQVLFKIHQFALALLERGAIVPTIFSNDKDEVFIRWQPAVLDTNVKEILTKISEMLDIRTVNLGLKPAKKTKIEPHYTDQSEATLTLLGMMLHFYIEESWIKTRYKKNISSLNIKIEGLFFMNLPASFSGYQEKDIPHLIRAWLGKFLLSERKYVPILSIQENFEEGDPDGESINNSSDYAEADETFSLEILIEDTELQNKHAENESPHIPLAIIFEDDSFEDVRLPIVQDLQILSDFLGEIKEIIETQGQVQKEIEATRLSKILIDIFPVLQILGIKILLPKRLEKIVRPKLKATLNSKNKKEESFLKLGSVWDFDWEVAMGEDKISAADFEMMIAQKAGLWRFRDQYVLLDEKEIALIVEQ